MFNPHPPSSKGPEGGGTLPNHAHALRRRVVGLTEIAKDLLIDRNHRVHNGAPGPVLLLTRDCLQSTTADIQTAYRMMTKNVLRMSNIPDGNRHPRAAIFVI